MNDKCKNCPEMVPGAGCQYVEGAECPIKDKADYTNLERLQGLTEFADECPEMLARYLLKHDFCVHPDGCPNKQIPCENCVENWLRERAEK